MKPREGRTEIFSFTSKIFLFRPQKSHLPTNDGAFDQILLHLRLDFYFFLYMDGAL